jgi:hypothetical protein
MAIIAGQIEPLKRLKKVLNENGIIRFNSIGEINAFIKNYEAEKKATPKIIENTLDEEISNLQSDIIKHQQIYDNLKIDILNELNHKIKNLEEALKQALEKSNKNLFNKVTHFLKIKTLTNKKLTLENNSEKVIREKTRITEYNIIKLKGKLDGYTENKEKIISARCAKSYKELDSTKEVVEGLYTLIAGAIGENLVVNELQKLPDNYYLINDFSVEFNPPIYNKKENDRIFSIQIDHLLICQSGVFLLETKNWSRQSINNLDLRSPVEQVLRTNYALFLLLNSESQFSKINLSRHHWGSKKIPIRNIIVMTNGKPKEEFKHVKVLYLDEINGYIKYFDQIFSEIEVENIFNHLKNEIY